MPDIRLINDGWRFSLDGGEPFPVDIPHDWLIGNARKFYESGVGIYTRKLDTSHVKPGQKVSLRFDGVYMDSSLYVNGSFAGEWKYGYTTFEHDITDLIKGEDELELKVNFDGLSARWYTGAGIYRNVWLIVRNSSHFAPDGIYVSTALTDGKWKWEVEAEVILNSQPYEVKHTLKNADGVEVGSEDEITAWDINNPYIYTLCSELIINGKTEDTVETRLGFRTTEFTPDEGFKLNGRRLKLNGVCMHHDLGGLGAAFHKDAARRQLDIMRAMGVNAIRTAHNPPAPELMDLCNEMGFLVLSELTDIWKRSKTPGDYARFFDEWVDRDAASWIRRDRNHPSVILWSVGNEIHDTHVDAEGGSATLRRMLDLVRLHDPKGNAPPTLCSNFMAWENTQKCVDDIGVIGYNYAENLYAEHHAAHPNWILYGSETCSTLQSRGVYHFPLSRTMLANDDLQCSALGNCTTSWGAKSVEACIRDDFTAPFSLGQFVWSGIDYLGEPTPYDTKNCYFGQADTAGFEKDSFYVFKAAWTDYKTEPFVHVYPYWDFSPGQLIDVRVCSNAPRVGLFLNDEKIGESGFDSRWNADWQVAYKPGVLRAEAYDENGNTIAVALRHSFGDAVSLKTGQKRYGELEFVTITVEDSEGRPVENANHRVKVSVEGGRLLALDNGDSSDYESYHSTSRRLFSGKLLAIVKREEGVEPVITVQADETDIPIRKIELLLENNQQSHGQAGACTITASFFPQNATYTDLTWRLTTAGGADTPLGELKISENGRSATMIPKGDGTVYVRCLAYDGREHPSLFSLREIEITGYGQPFIDPYSFVTSGIYNLCNVEPASGIEGGVSSQRDSEMHIGFSGLDFGSFGSDKLKLWLFPLSDEEFDFEVWEGMPEDNGEKLCTIHYDKGSIWYKYIEAEYTLPRRLRGVTTLGLVFRNRLHIKGFVFDRLAKGFARLNAAENDGIYGDMFEVAGSCVEQIGNNVSITYDDMDFGESGTGAIKLRYRSKLPENTMRIDFAGESGTTTQMITLPGAEDYKEATFTLSKQLKGQGKINLVFLPGSDLDLEWIMFS